MGLDRKFVLHSVDIKSEILERGKIVFRSKEPVPTYVTIESMDQDHLMELIAANEFFITVEDANECTCDPGELGIAVDCPVHRINASTPEDLDLLPEETEEKEEED